MMGMITSPKGALVRDDTHISDKMNGSIIVEMIRADFVNC